MISTGVSQAIPVLVSPILSRLFSPEEFGVLALFLTVASALSVLATGRLELAVVLPEDDQQATKVMRLGLELALLFSIFLSFFFILAKDASLFFIHVPTGFTPYYAWLGPTIFLYAAYQMLSYWLLRKNAYWPSAINKISQTSTTTAINLGVGLLKLNIGLIYSEILGRFAGTLIGYYQSIKSEFRWPKLHHTERISIFQRYKKFVYFASFPAFLDTLTSNLPVFFLTSWYTAEVTGYYQLSRMVLIIPIALVSAAVGQVLLRKTVELKNNQRTLTSWYLKIALVLTVSFLPFFIALSFVGTELFKFVFGAKWAQSGLFATILAGSYYMRFVVAPLSSVFPALEKVKISGGWHVFYSIVLGSMVFLKGIDVKGFLVCLLSAELFAYAVYFLLIIKTVKEFDKSLHT